MTRVRGNTEGGTSGGFGVLVLGHGSQAQHVEEELEKITANIAHKTGLEAVSASLQFSDKTITSGLKQLYEAGHRNIIIAPLFLFKGNHILKDIPEWLEKELALLPDLIVTMTDPIGSDLRVAEAVVSQIRKAVEVGYGSASLLSHARDEIAPIDVLELGDDKDHHVNEQRAHPFLSKAPQDIETESFSFINKLLGAYELTDEEQKVVYRMVHASGDPSLVEDIRMSKDLIPAFRNAVNAKAAVYCDVKMLAAGIDKHRCEANGISTHVLIDDPEVLANSQSTGQTRAVWAMKKAWQLFGNNMIVVIGNSPTALFTAIELHREAHFRPAAIIGTPVGFVGAKEAKAMLLECGIPFVTVSGFKGGSAIAASAFNGLMRCL